MPENDRKAVALCLGIGAYEDHALGALPAASSSARDIARALDPDVFGTVRVAIDPPRFDDVFVALHTAIRAAKHGRLFLYITGHVIRRDGELLLAAGDTNLDARLGAVPFADIQDLLVRELVDDALIVLNVHRADADAPPPAIDRTGVSTIAALHPCESERADARIRATHAALLRALEAPAKDIASRLHDGLVDAESIATMLRAASDDPDTVLAIGHGSKLVVRDLRAKLAEAAAQPVPAPTEAAAPPPAAPEPAKAEVPAATAAPEKKAEAPAPKHEPAPRPPASSPLAPAPVAVNLASLWMYVVALAGVFSAAVYWMTHGH